MHTKKEKNANVVPLEKGTTKTKSAVPLEKEQQKRKCRSFGKGTAKWTVIQCIHAKKQISCSRYLLHHFLVI